MDTADFLLLLDDVKRRQAYADKVKATFGTDIVAYFPYWEASGSVADNYEGTAALDGAYTGVTLGQTGIGDGRTCPYFDGANDVVDHYSAAFNAAFDGAETTIFLWVKLSAGKWSDGSGCNIVIIRVDSGDVLYISKDTADRVYFIAYGEGDGLYKWVDCSGYADTWHRFAITRSETADEVKFYHNAVQQGDTKTGLGSWSGNLASDRVVVGAKDTAPAEVVDGWLAHYLILNRPATLAELVEIDTV